MPRSSFVPKFWPTSNDRVIVFDHSISSSCEVLFDNSALKMEVKPQSQEMPSSSRDNQLDRFCRQYLQLLPNLDYPDEEHLRDKVFQEAIYLRLFDESVLEYPPPQRYQLKTLKELTRRIENSIHNWEEQGISDNLMSHLSILLSTPIPSEATAAQQQSYVTYTLSSFHPPSSSSTSPTPQTPTITILESASLLSSSGTTGLRTWEAALHLSNYISLNPHLISNKTILELGCGTGFISILCAKYLSAKHVLATDGSPETLTLMNTSLFLNNLTDVITPITGQIVTNKISTCELTWGHMLPTGEAETFPDFLSSKSLPSSSSLVAGSNQTPLDLILAADVIYSPAVIPSLIVTLEDLFGLYPAAEVLISSTIRNADTYAIFVDMCRKKQWAIERVDFGIAERSEQEGPWYGGLGEGIEILWVRNTNGRSGC
ncbi:hypothetical protein SS1G_00950 [Sclerotinia sclerotiorum 1980 UF-70]|uniref:FAM86 N-terminal domain-containing protein n=2 Tax=Sclerotinia sclerotiorum (strain ATCC 18683 / 1980 / Ss-1) TaxID=665079 RepID=A7E6M5_SCLS1|nr:hypothetical protein SS1G_00950 [Sclerotinia sclerotiorum 1980 UF-70]APA07550.1 hypothetical protein sscle_03g023200 [Sclerotinia sclerotiorum 1980 UF-70]EDN91547.1 hypothetical protein SS1G_00950 [Sclerotinia sclerotiorum 1980 UF-70]